LQVRVFPLTLARRLNIIIIPFSLYATHGEANQTDIIPKVLYNNFSISDTWRYPCFIPQCDNDICDIKNAIQWFEVILL